ncbi:MAG: sugar transferase, partial [Candidatus Omnitrophota bacterium]
MFKYRVSIYRKINIAVDALITGASFVLAILIRGYWETGSFVFIEHYFRYFWYLLYFLMFLWPLLLIFNGLYPTDRLRTAGRAAQIILKSSLQGFLIVLAVLFVFRLQIVSRLLVVGFAVIVTGLLILKEGFVVWRLRALRESGANLRNVLVVGTSKSARDIVASIEKNKFLGLNIVGILVPQEEVEIKGVSGRRVLGALKDIEGVIHENPIDHVIITIDKKDYKDVEDIVAHCEEEGVEVWLTASLFNLRIAKLDADDLFGMPMFVFRTIPQYSWQLFVKSIIDYVGSFVALLISIPIIAVAAAAIKMNSEGPIFFKQKRSGLQGREFTLYKLRTMYIDAHDKIKDLREENILKGPVFKLVHDPRVTRVGHFLRKTSIDELPQLWNVLKGDMSLVGPRPPIPDEVNQYKGWQRRRLSMKPGITGLWQV